jgi:hypothetical protein
MTARRWTDEEWANVLDQTAMVGEQAAMRRLAMFYSEDDRSALERDPAWRVRLAEVYENLAQLCTERAAKWREHQASADGRRRRKAS